MMTTGSNSLKDKKKTGWTGEVIRFALTGGACFLLEFAALVFLRDGIGIDTLIATPIAFLLSVILNYLLCMSWVFRSVKDSGNTAKAGFALTSIIGLLLNEGLMILFRFLFGEDTVLTIVMGRNVSMYMANKCLATLLVMIWNYFTKKAILTSDFTARLAARFRKT